MLINLVSIHTAPSPQSIPLANAFLKAFALKSSVSITLIDFFLEDDAGSCALKLVDPFPDAVGFSMYVWNRKRICDIAAELRRNHPALTLFCGGPEVTADPDSVANGGVFDFVIVGEGEVPFLSVCRALSKGLDVSEIPGVHLPGTIKPLIQPPVADLDLLPSPYLTGVIDTNSNPGILWQLSRGCSFTCDFCFDSRGIHGVRHFSLTRIESELHHFTETGVSQVFVLDSTFNLNPVRAKKILKMIKNIAPDIHFHFEVRSEFIDREMAKLFAQITCSLQIGLQSADHEVLRLVGRSFKKADFSAKVGLLNDSGATFGFDLIYGLPGDTLKGFFDTLDFALALYPNHLDIFPLAVLPGTKLAERGTALDMRWNPKPPYILEETGTFSVADMAAAAELATACDIFYTRGKAVAWFNAIIRVIGLKPSELLQKFSVWLHDYRGRITKESDLGDDDVWQIQELFLKHLFSSKKVKKFLPLVLDLVQYHHQYAVALLAPRPDASGAFDRSLNVRNACLKLAPSAGIIHFSYEIDELLECGEPQISSMYQHLTPTGSQAVIYNNNGMVCTESLAIPYILFLENIRDGNSGDLASGTGLTSDEADEFIVFALQEGIVVKDA